MAMSDDIKPEIIKKTQDALGKFIKKPILTEKLLAKPPFRFLHDICTAVMRETGFFEGVLSPSDCKADNIKDKDGKIAFLVKVIAAVGLGTGFTSQFFFRLNIAHLLRVSDLFQNIFHDEKPTKYTEKDNNFLSEAANGIKLAVRPNKVVAGHEPARTNEFLQALGRALENQVKNENVSQSKSDPKPDAKTESDKSQQKVPSRTTKKAEKEELSSKKRSSLSNMAKLSRTEKTPGSRDSKKKEDSKNNAKPEKKSPNSKEDQQKKLEISPRNAEINREDNQTEENERIRKKGEQNKLKSSQLPSSDSSDMSTSKKTKNRTDDFNDNVKIESEQLENKRPISARPGHRKPVIVSETVETVTNLQPLPTKETERLESVKGDATISKSPVDAPKRTESTFLRLSKENSSSSSVPPNYSIKDSDVIEDSSPVSRPVTSIRPTTGRPASARPAAPRIKDRGEISVHEDVVKQSTGNVVIITDNNEGTELEDENIVTVEAETDLMNNESDSTDQIDPINDQNTNQGESGLLVNQILETQKELNQSRMQILENKSSGKTDIEWKSSRNRDATDREIKKLRLCIQTLTRSVNPLGKLLDFLQEDVDVMQKELITWKEMNSNLDLQIDEERSLTEQSVEPLKVHLKELQQNIEHQLDQITIVKANILRNDLKIQRLLTEMK